MDMAVDTEGGDPNATVEDEDEDTPRDCEFAADSLVEQFGDPFGRDFPTS